jgi:hypothetical protein
MEVYVRFRNPLSGENETYRGTIANAWSYQNKKGEWVTHVAVTPMCCVTVDPKDFVIL